MWSCSVSVFCLSDFTLVQMCPCILAQRTVADSCDRIYCDDFGMFGTDQVQHIVDTSIVDLKCGVGVTLKLVYRY